MIVSLEKIYYNAKVRLSYIIDRRLLMVNISNADERQLSEMKAWFFKENIRIQEAKQALEEERRQFEHEKKETFLSLEHQEMINRISKEQLEREQKLFEKKVMILQNELRRLADEKQQLEKEKTRLKEQKTRHQGEASYPSSRIFFRGVNSELALKKRYRDLIKIFHPDNMNGDTISIQNINKEYDMLKNIYSI